MKQIEILIFFVFVLAFSSCKKFLDVNPDNRAEIDNVEKLAKLVGTAYPQYGYLAMAEMYSDNVGDKGPQAPGTHTNNPYPQLYKWEDVKEEGNNTPTQYWNGVYEGIAAANQALDAATNDIFGKAADPYKGEALIARAYGHFMLVTFFAKAYEPGGSNSSPGIPYVLAPETVPVVKYSRGTVASVYEQIEKDLEEGISLLAGGHWDVPKYHFTPAAAHAFAARFYLFKGEWQKVIDHANKIFPGGDFKGNLRDFNGEALNIAVSEEYRRWWNNGDQKFNIMLHETYSVYQRSSSFGTSRFGFTRTIYNQSNGNTAAGKNFNWRAWTTGGTDNLILYKYFEYFHYTNVTAGIGYPYIMMPLFTADEALMNRAEAYAQLGQLDNAIKDCNLFATTRILDYNPTTHAVTVAKSKTFFNVTDDKEAIIKTVLDFKKRAFLTEGLRWFDILRHKITVKHNFLDADGEETFIELGPEDNRRMFQIPEQATKLSDVEPNPR